MVQNNAERCAKYRAENSEKFKLIAAIQQFKRSKELASESLDAEKMRRAAALRKRMQRERENEREMEREKSTGRIVTRGTESKNVNEGDNAQCIVHSAQCLCSPTAAAQHVRSPHLWKSNDLCSAGLL